MPVASFSAPIVDQAGAQAVAFQALPQEAQPGGFQGAPGAAFPGSVSQGQVPPGGVSAYSAYPVPDPPVAPSNPPAALSSRVRESAEMWFGKYVASIVAAILVFIGLSLFGIIVFPQLSDEVRVAIMFAVSGSLVAIGSALELRRGNELTLALMCCGALSLFASALVVRSSFGHVQEAIAFALILALMAVRLLVGRKHEESAEPSASDAPISDRHFRIVSVVFVSLLAGYECTLGFLLLSLNVDATTAALLGASYVAMIGGTGALLLRQTRASAGGIVGYAVACTVLLMTYLHFCTPLAGEDYTWSVCCMACALVCVVIGFHAKIGGLRLYGLILTLVCVVKLVTVDIMDLDDLQHAAAFVIGGLICFAVSALYHYAVKRLLAS